MKVVDPRIINQKTCDARRKRQKSIDKFLGEAKLYMESKDFLEYSCSLNFDVATNFEIIGFLEEYLGNFGKVDLTVDCIIKTLYAEVWMSEDPDLKIFERISSIFTSPEVVMDKVGLTTRPAEQGGICFPYQSFPDFLKNSIFERTLLILKRNYSIS